MRKSHSHAGKWTRLKASDCLHTSGDDAYDKEWKLLQAIELRIKKLHSESAKVE